MPDFRPFDRDTLPDGPRLWIQWKGTQPCADFHCVCGAFGHLDEGYFMYFVRCPSCGQGYMVSANVALLPLTPEETEHVGSGEVTAFRVPTDVE